MKRRYVTAFPGRRDHYQMPVSLAENGRLAGFATCFYQGRGLLGRLPGLRSRLSSRQAPGLHAAPIECLEITNLLARLGAKVLQPSRVAVTEDLAFARKALAMAKAKAANLFLYEFQADWAFRQPEAAGAVKILFQFHTHPDLEHPLLLADAQRYPQFLEQIRRDTRGNLPERFRAHTRGAWRSADHVIVASRFTAQSLETAGCPADRITVVPYGCSIASAPAPASGRPPGAARPYFLFVGSGTHRKGLHHLLEAWSGSRLTATHELIVIARVVDPLMAPFLSQAPSVRHIPGVSAPELAQWYRGAKAFVLPSLSEGFGHVYLEALASGCPVIGTRHSMLPDFEKAQAHVRYVEPCDPEGLRDVLEAVAGTDPSHPFFQTASVRESVLEFTWERFRRGIESVLERFD